MVCRDHSPSSINFLCKRTNTSVLLGISHIRNIELRTYNRDYNYLECCSIKLCENQPNFIKCHPEKKTEIHLHFQQTSIFTPSGLVRIAISQPQVKENVKKGREKKAPNVKKLIFDKSLQAFTYTVLGIVCKI